jgi:hypothetical protein
MPADSTDEQQLSGLFAALANPMVRHLIELLALERRPRAELVKHFDLIHTDVIRLGENLCDLGLISAKRYDDFVFVEGGLAPVQDWLDRIKSLKKPAPA